MIQQIRKTAKRCDTLIEDTIGLAALVALLLAALHFPAFA